MTPSAILGEIIMFLFIGILIIGFFYVAIIDPSKNPTPQRQQPSQQEIMMNMMANDKIKKGKRR